MTRIASLAIALLLILSPSLLPAQNQFGDLLQGLDGLGGGGSSNPEVKISATFVVDPAGTHGRVDITATVGQSWALYSTTQPKGGPMATRLKVDAGEAISQVGEFTADHKPKIVPPDDIIRVRQEKFYNKVTWSAPFILKQGVNPETLKPEVTLSGQSCHDRGTCVPVSAKATATVAGREKVELPEKFGQSDASPPATMGPPKDYKIQGSTDDFQAPNNSAILYGTFSPAKVAAGEEVTVTLTVAPAPGYHVYVYSPLDDTIGYKSTQIALAEVTPWLALQPKTPNPIVEKELVAGFPPVKYHTGKTTWTFTVQVPIDAQLGSYPLVGYMGYQLCTDTSCDRPTGAMFEGLVEVAENATKSESARLAFSEAKYAQAAQRAKATHTAVQEDTAAPNEEVVPPLTELDNGGANIPPAAGGNSIQWTVLNPPESSGLAWIMLFSFIGGAILNLMPCVLPVVGLKILSFVHQAGKNRGAVFMLNLVYSTGVISVFLVLAVLSSSLTPILGLFMDTETAAAGGGSNGMAWGQWSGDWRYILGMIVLVYTMGLSMLGVWELSVPSFLGGGSAVSMTNQSGLGGAFFKGVLTTLLSTPCSGPFLGPVFGYTVTQPSYVTFLVFGFIGLGMASPYLIIGMNPRLIAFLPKPGNWMVAFKQAMGFVMMLTVVYLLYTLQDQWVVPTLTLLVGLGAGCWMLGQLHHLESSHAKTATTLGALALSLGVGWFAFNNLVEDGSNSTEIPWVTYYEENWPTLESDIHSRQMAGETVMVDFTADWCPTCKVNYYTAINTSAVEDVIAEHNIAPKLVDWTNTTHENSVQVQQFINKLGSNSIPLLAIFPGGRPGEVLVLSDLLTESKVIENLNAATRSAQEVPRQTARQRSSPLGK